MAAPGNNNCRRLTSTRIQVTPANPQTGARDISGLERLYVRDSSLSGAIPTWLTSLEELEYLYLDGNDFTGCIPAGLRDVTNNDFDRMSLPDCTS